MLSIKLFKPKQIPNVEVFKLWLSINYSFDLNNHRVAVD